MYQPSSVWLCACSKGCICVEMAVCIVCLHMCLCGNVPLSKRSEHHVC